MPKNRLPANSATAQPLLSGINLARFLCAECPFFKLTEPREKPNGNCSGLPPSEAVVQAVCEFNPLVGDDGELPGRL